MKATLNLYSNKELSINTLLEKLCLNGQKSIYKSKQSIDFDLIHPLRLIKHNEILPINTMFNSKSESFSKITLEALNNKTNPYEVIEILSRRSPLFLQEVLSGDISTFVNQINTSFFRLYMHSFFLQGGNIAKLKGKQATTNCAYIPLNYDQFCDFDEKVRPVEGYYIFIGEESSSIVIQGKPLNSIAGPRLIIHEFEFTQDLLPKEYKFIKKCFLDRCIEGSFVSTSDVFEKHKKLNLTISKTLNMLEH